MEKVGKLLLEETASKARAQGVETVETALLGKDAAHDWLHCAETNDINLIVMTTHGQGGIHRVLVGSITEQVTRSTPVPVLVVPSGP